MHFSVEVILFFFSMIEVNELYMRRCFQLAKRGLGYVAPNPMVGAVIVGPDGRIIGEGYHRQWGGPHAEVNAVASVADKSLLASSTIYVSLEPCSHYGKTPPCAKLLIDHKIPKVVVACNDPFPEVAGRGFQMLREAGAEVVTGVLEAEGWELNRRFFTFHTRKRPYIILKWAQTADGFMAAASDERLLISSSESMALVHQLRAQESAIMVGTNTVLADNPSLTVRDYAGKNPLRIVVDRRLRIPCSAKLLSDGGKTLVFCEILPEKNDNENVAYIQAPFDDNGVNIHFIMEVLYQRQVQSLVVEGGPSLLRSFLSAGLVDECRVEVNASLFAMNGLESPKPVGRCVEQFQIGNNVVTRFRQ